MVYQLLLEDGSKSGNYSIKSSPAQTAKKMAKQLYEDSRMNGKQTFTFQFVKNRTKADGGDKDYEFRATVTPLQRTQANWVAVGNGGFYKKFDIEVENLLRA